MEWVAASTSVQVGDVDKDHSNCIRAELDTQTPRPVLIVDTEHPGADVLAIAAAAFASASMALAQAPAQQHQKLAGICLQHAFELYDAAGRMRQEYCRSLPECAKTYRATVWQQYMFYAAAWLFKVTGEVRFEQVSPSLGTCFACRALTR